MNKKKKISLIVLVALAAFVVGSWTNAAPVVVVPGEGAGYVYYSANAGAAPAPAADTSFVGMIAAFSKTPPADKWVVCNGQTISKAAYPELVEFLAGSAAASAVMPNYQGYFLRGANTTGAGLDAGRTVGSVQGDAIRNIAGTYYAGRITWTGAGGVVANGPFFDAGEMYSAIPGSSSGSGGNRGIGFDASRQVPTAAENRPYNIAVIYAMRAK